ncbi:MAG: CPBP family intramembrane glutamic endopeptidase [Acidobacteriota bacterium]
MSQQDSAGASRSSALLDSAEIRLRVGVFIGLVLLCRFLLPSVMVLLPWHGDLLVRSTLLSFGTGFLASYLCAVLFADGRLSDIGLSLGHDHSASSSVPRFLTGLLAGAVAASATILVPVTLGWATWEAVDLSHPTAAAAGVAASGDGIPVSLGLLLLGATGEELMFHGYAFQMLVGQHGKLPQTPLREYLPIAMVIAVAVIFGLAHVSTNHAPPLAAINTTLWGFLLGYVCWRTGSLWASIGLHFGWNLALPLLGVNLSGITIGITNSTLQWTVGDLWSGGAYGPEGGLLTTGVAVILFLLFRQADQSE